MVTARKASQLLFFLLFLSTFALCAYPMVSIIPLHLFFHLSPLTFLITFLPPPYCWAGIFVDGSAPLGRHWIFFTGSFLSGKREP